MILAERVRELVSSKLRVSVADFIDLESMEDDRTLTTRTGNLVTVVKLEGALGMFSRVTLQELAGRVRLAVAPFVARPGHALQFFFSQDPAAGSAVLDREVEKTGRAARGAGLDLEDLLQERQAHLSGYVVEERCLLVLHTAVSVLDRQAKKRAGEERARKLKGSPAAVQAQIPDRVLEPVWTRHRALVDSLVHEIRRNGFLAEALEVGEALREIRAVVRPETSHMRAAWQPRLPAWASRAAPPFAVMPDNADERAGMDVSNLFAPVFADQLADVDALEVDPGVIRLGDCLVGGFDVTLFQESLTPFDALVDRLSTSSRRFPWRVVLSIEPGGLQAVGLKNQFVRVFSWAAGQNKRIRDSVAGLREIEGREDTVVRFRLSFAAWGPASSLADFRDALASLRSVVQQWGSTQVDGLSGDPLATTLASVPGISRISTAPVVAAPLEAALMVSPISRQASPWRTGSVLFRTDSGKLWPYQPGSARQNTWVDLCVGTPGSGKSVSMNAVNLALILSAPDGPGGELPRVGIIDIGMTSAGLIDLVQGALPAARRSEAVYRRLRNSDIDAINPFDTQLGMRRPLSGERQFLVNFMAVLCAERSPDGSDRPPSSAMMGLISAALEAAYRRRSDGGEDGGEPALYSEGDDIAVDRALRETGFGSKTASTLWWEAVDHLMASGRPADAGRAQRYAVPILGDLSRAAGDAKVRDMYGSATDNETGQSLIESFQRRVSEAVRDFPILSRATRFSLANARIVSLDLDEVTPRGAGSARQTALMYMLARYVLSRNFYLDDAEFEAAVKARDLPDVYEEYHVRRARRMRETPKRLCIDEFHRTGGVPGLLAQVMQDVREGRKFNTQIALASQVLSDFPPELLEMVSTAFICKAPSATAADGVVKAFDLGEVEREIISRELNGPTSQGAPFFLVGRIREGVVRQKLWLTLGPVELWALSTTAEDVALRRLLYESLGPGRARAVLAARFPAGTARPELEARKVRLEEAGGSLNAEAEQGLIEALAEELERVALRAVASDARIAGRPGRLVD